ncbi:hypothetical protein [Catenulispora pinisilvae]|uniref:hypothetical protein n=1 Tax=Catenulispora pinisilvae TaxID=2705253 RepID=UPI001E6491A1|nr:hypothetical protein [Catenulispora pinisilvae]
MRSRLKKQRGDEEFVELTTARGAHLLRTAYLLTGDWHLAEDLVQEALGRLFYETTQVEALPSANTPPAGSKGYQWPPAAGTVKGPTDTGLAIYQPGYRVRRPRGEPARQVSMAGIGTPDPGGRRGSPNRGPRPWKGSRAAEPSLLPVRHATPSSQGLPLAVMFTPLPEASHR